MRGIDKNTLAALTGSRQGDGITAYVWYAGKLAVPTPLPISAWGLDWDITRQVQSGSVTVADVGGKLAPWLLEDPLGVGGSRLQITYQVGGAGTVNLGWYRITQSQPTEAWRSYTIDNLGQINPNSPIPPGKRRIDVTGGAKITLNIQDLGVVIANDQLEAPDSPRTATVVSEVVRLLDGIVPVVSAPGVVDRSVNSTLVYQGDRLNAVQDLCKRISCDYRMNGNGQFEIYPVAAQTPLWTVQGGPEGALVSVDRSQSLDGLFNVFIADGTATVTRSDGTTAQVPIRGRAAISSGPLRAGGPHGNYRKFYSSTMLTTQAQCDAYAAVMRDTQIAGLTTDLVIQCLPNPSLQQGDWVTVAAPVVNGQAVTLNGRIKTMSLKSVGNSVDKMTLTVACSYADVQTVMGGVFRG